MGFEKIPGDEGHPEKEPCPKCKGDGEVDGETCDHCDGSGKDPYA